MFIEFFYLCFLAGLASSASIPSKSLLLRNDEISAETLLKAIPNSASCPSPPGECATSSQAAPFINQAMAKYSITSPAEKASIVALIAYESSDFKYNINHYPAPGNPGQGTRNMQSSAFNLEYVKSLPELASQISYTTTEGLNPDQLNEIRALVLPDEYTWASGAWYLTQQKPCAEARSVLQNGNADDGFVAHMRCVGVSPTERRLAYWRAAKSAFGA